MPANIGLDWKGLPGSNTLASYENPQITAVINFKVHEPGLYHDQWGFLLPQKP